MTDLIPRVYFHPTFSVISANDRILDIDNKFLVVFHIEKKEEKKKTRMQILLKEALLQTLSKSYIEFIYEQI